MTSLQKLLVDGFLVSLVSIAVASGCGGDDDDTAGTGATGGKGGTSGAGGKGGSSGKGGSGGSSGTSTGGKGGTGGSTGGKGGAGGAGGSAMGGEGGEVTAGGAGGEGGAATAASCEAYCEAIQSTCGDTGEDAQYPSDDQCLATCAVFPTGALTGNTLECRIAHVALAATTGLDPHCDHAGPAGVEPCGGPCTSYCTLMLAICDDKFASLDECRTECEMVPEADITNFVYPAPAGDTLSCRIAHATNAAASTGQMRENHCAHAAGEMAPCT
jgi:hypothetical protein